MKIGDRVRFLNETGGGIITAFIGKNLVNVETEDGFDMPMPLRDIVVIETDEYNFEKKTIAPPQKEADSTNDTEESETEPADRPITFTPAPMERKGGDKLSLYFALVPISPLQLQDTDFEIYLINDCNYYIDYTYLSGENNNWKLRYRGTLEPNTKMYVETIERSALNELEHLCFQTLAYKQGKNFLLQSPTSIKLNPDLTKCYKLHTFQISEFFEEKVQLFNLILEGKPSKESVFNAEEIKQSMMSSNSKIEPNRIETASKTVNNQFGDEIIVDLHAKELLETTAGMQPSDILEYQIDVFKKTMEAYKQKKGRKIVFIHGKGNGILRNRILQLLRHKYPHCSAQDASFREYGFGATLVKTPR